MPDKLYVINSKNIYYIIIYYKYYNMNNEKTVWNKELFSDTNQKINTDNENFQTINMIYKIKKIKKNKKPKLENYKNIETLKNIHDETIIEDNVTPIIEGLQGRVSVDDPNFLGLPDEDFDGIDVPSKRVADDPRQRLIDNIDYIYARIDKFNYYNAYIFARAFSGKKPEKNDVNVLKKYIGWFETILISYFACYNWFFIMFYRYNHNDKVDEELLGKRFKTPILDTYRLQNESFNRVDFWGMIYKFINYFFIYCLMFVEYLQNIMMEKIPNMSKMIFNLKGCFVLIFFIMLYFFQYFTTWLYGFLKDVISGNTNNLTVGLMYFVLILGYFFGTYNYGYVVKTPGYTFHSFTDTFMGMPFTFITGFMRFIFIMLISVPVGAVLCVFYIVYQSLFGILFNVSLLEFLGVAIEYKGIFQRINEYIKDNNRSNNAPIKNLLNLAIDKFLYSNIMSISLLVMFIFAIIDYNTGNNIKNNNLKINLNVITAILILIFFTIIASKIYEDFKITEITNPTLDVNEPEFDLMGQMKILVSDLVKELLKPIIDKSSEVLDKMNV